MLLALPPNQKGYLIGFFSLFCTVDVVTAGRGSGAVGCFAASIATGPSISSHVPIEIYYNIRANATNILGLLSCVYKVRRANEHVQNAE
jgi:hypothetical protein